MSRRTSLDLLHYARSGLVGTLDGLTLEQVNRIPNGFNNNLAWQLGHVIAVEQKYIYEKGGKEMRFMHPHVDVYGNGTKPEKDIDQETLDTFKTLALGTIAKLKDDCMSGHFETYTGFGLGDIKIETIDEALPFILFHEGLHLGAARNLRRAVTA